ncbi:hypothetical protein [Pyxidicoccus xibeiensis]|uniref:hypothetical protein n=1 Tax=Pyxidicoccus xibeiensis TaxID=2906759 RepID=UPI0020A70A89|nr:hypothetical protein [Pyxidicoccus xibeiensis]MCP3143903.1 hypothetical protein [Pyxidicoccus xibeiensis]
MRLRSVLAVLLGWWVLGAGCAMGMAGAIPPAAFQFHRVVPQEGPEGGGWKVAQTSITLTRVSQTQPVQAQCDVEVGLPMSTRLGAIPDLMAQEQTALAADQAARFALGKRPATSAELCGLFVEEMRRLLTAQLPGVRVRRFVETGIPRTKFVPE